LRPSSDFRVRLGASLFLPACPLSYTDLVLFCSVCANRIFVQDGVYDAFAEKLATAVRAFKVGEGTGEGITHGPLIHAAAVDKVQHHVEDAKSKGAKVLVGGERLDMPGHFFQVSACSPHSRWLINAFDGRSRRC
jgi:hypothetical protein